MDAKREILDSIRQGSVPRTDLPASEFVGSTYDDLDAQFANILKAVGGLAIRVPDRNSLKSELQNLDVYRNAKRIVSQIDDLPAGNVDLSSVEDPHDLDHIDLMILPGDFAVAENGAVWVTDRGLAHRVAYVIADHLILVVPASEIVHNMHQAYQRLSFSEPGYGLFISGPSKTADITQILVIGAQGALSTHVFLVE